MTVGRITLRANLLRPGLGASAGVIYGAALRFGFGLAPQRSIFETVTVDFVLFTPFAMGFITVFVTERRQPQGVWTWFVFPWISVLAWLVAPDVFLWEGTICILMFAPVALVAATLGGVAAGLIVRVVRSRASRNTTLVCVACFPFLITPFERQLLLQRDLRSVESAIDVKA